MAGGRGFGGRTGGAGRMGAMMCPATEPAGGGTCTPGRGDCMFGTRVCDCPNDTMTWSCWDPEDCPDTAPADMSACTTVGMQCEYGRGGCDCETGGWDCNGIPNGGMDGGGADSGGVDAGM